MPRWDLFDRDNARQSEPRPPQEDRLQRPPSSNLSLGRGANEDVAGDAAERSVSARPREDGGVRQPGIRYRDRGRVYRLRGSEVAALSDIGKFRTVDVQDLARFVYGGEEDRMRREVEHLREHGLVEQKTVFRAHKAPRQIVTLTKRGHRLVRKASGLPKEQKLYHGFVKARETNHDADLYQVYQQGAQEIRERGGTPVRVRLDFELKAAVQRERDAAKALPEEEQVRRLQAFAEEHGLTLRGTRIHVPDIQLEYETRDHEIDRANLELVSENYRSEAIRTKAESGFRLYARGNDATRVRRALEDTRSVESILSL